MLSPVPVSTNIQTATCSSFVGCDECLLSEVECKYCPEEKRCVAVESEAVCAVPFLSKEDEEECPLITLDSGSALTPFACIIVLFSFLIMLL